MVRYFCFIVFVELLISCGQRREPQIYTHPHDTVSIQTVIIDKLKVNDVTLGKPKPYEWLGVNNEPGQPFEKYITLKPISPDQQRTKIYLQPIGHFTPLQDSIIKYTSDYLEIFFDVHIELLPTISDGFIPDACRRYKGEVDEQLLTTTILDYLKKNLPADAIIIEAITQRDLYPGSQMNFVFGQASIRSRVGVCSLFRFADKESSLTLYRTLLDRFIKTSSHEIGHAFSIQHCIYGECVMNGSNSLVEADGRPNRLCTDCLRKLQWNIRFDVLTRQQSLVAFFSRHKLKRDYEIAFGDLQLLAP